MLNVLFVDDEVNILSGLKRTLRSMKDEWNMQFANSGDEAIAMLGAAKFDVIVSDIRMPGMDGVQLLLRVKKDYPHIIRLALSGHAETEMELECAKAAHQFLAKPAETETIRAAINRSANLKSMLSDETLQATVGNVVSLPSLPELYQKILNEAADPEGRIMRVGDIISEDLAMSMKILQLVNSAFFGLSSNVSSVKQAAGLLGFEIIKSLVLSQKIFSAYEGEQNSGLDLEGLIRHSTKTAMLAGKIAAFEGLSSKECDQAVMAGMLHDVGVLLLADLYPERYAKVNLGAKIDGVSMREAEVGEFGVSHAPAGGYLLGLWGLPDVIVEAVCFHHQPGMCADNKFSVLSSVYLANIITNACEQNLDNEAIKEKLDTAYLEKVGSKSSIEDLRRMAES